MSSLEVASERHTPDYLVIPDSHGQYEKISRIVDEFEPEVDRFLFLGDVLNGPDTRSLVSLIRGLGDKALTITGNHEWACRNALAEGDTIYLEKWRDEIWPKYEKDRMLDSYGLKISTNPKDNARSLREALDDTGDLAWLNSLQPYYEEEDFIAVHAGPALDKPWASQAVELDEASLPGNRIEEEPDQIFSSKLARMVDVPASVNTRVFVTGHAHNSLRIDQRRGSRRIRLASRIADGEPFFVWDSASNTIYPR